MEVVAIKQPKKTLEVLESLRLKVTPAGDGISGIREIIQREPDFVLVDVDLPHLHGINLAKILDLIELNVPLVFTAETERYRSKALSFRNTLEYALHSDLDNNFMNQILTRIPVRPDGSMNFPFSMTSNEWRNLLSAPGRTRLLLVEDEKDQLLILTTLLKQMGEYELFSAKNGLEGLRKAVAVNPDLIISDIDMPVLDGLSMSQILYILGKPYPIVFLTNLKNDAIVERAKNLDGVIGYMLKQRISDITAFQNDIRRHIEMGRLALETSSQSYRSGALEPLVRTGTTHGVLQSISDG